MKRMLVAVAVGAGILILVRRFGPALGQRMMRKCEEMFDRMPEDFPPKQMMRGIEDIREQNAEILRRAEQSKPRLGQRRTEPTAN